MQLPENFTYCYKCGCNVSQPLDSGHSPDIGSATSGNTPPVGNTAVIPQPPADQASAQVAQPSIPHELVAYRQEETKQAPQTVNKQKTTQKNSDAWMWIELALIIITLILIIIFLLPSCGASAVTFIPIFVWFRSWSKRYHI